MSAIFGFTFDILGRMTEVLTPDIYRAHCMNNALRILIFCQVQDNNKFKTIVSFDCRGLEPTDFSPRVSGNIIRNLKVYLILPSDNFNKKCICSFHLKRM